MKNKPKTLTTIRNKYTRKVAKVLRDYQDKSMEELWKKLDEVKEKMRVELNEIGIT